MNSTQPHGKVVTLWSVSSLVVVQHVDGAQPVADGALQALLSCQDFIVVSKTTTRTATSHKDHEPARLMSRKKLDYDEEAGKEWKPD